jgi:hypothetical protein
MREADEAALETYAAARERGEAPDRALTASIRSWVARCDCVDGREARTRVVEVLLRTRTMGPRDYADWVVVALGKDVWDSGAPAAVERLPLDRRTVDHASERQQEFEQVAADELRDYLRLELPRKVRRLRRLARELLPAGTVRDA